MYFKSLQFYPSQNEDGMQELSDKMQIFSGEMQYKVDDPPKIAGRYTVVTSGINDDNKNNDDIIPSVKAVADYVNNNISGIMDFATVKDTSASTLSISNETEGICAVRVTKMSDGSTQYQSNVNPLGDLGNKKNAFTFNIEVSANYMVEAWFYNSGTNKLIPTAVKFI